MVMYHVVKLLQQQPHKIHHHFHLSEWYEVVKLLQQQPLSIPYRYHLIILKETKVLHNPVTCRIFYLDTNLSNPFPIVNMIPYLGTILFSLPLTISGSGMYIICKEADPWYVTDVRGRDSLSVALPARTGLPFLFSPNILC